LFLLLTLAFLCCSNDYKTDLGNGYYLDTYSVTSVIDETHFDYIKNIKNIIIHILKQKNL